MRNLTLESRNSIVCDVSLSQPKCGYCDLVVTPRGLWRVFRSCGDVFVVGCPHEVYNHSECLGWQNHEVDGMLPKLTLFQNVSLLLRAKIVSRAGYGLRPYRHVEDTCGPVGSYIADPRGAREVYDPLTVPKTCIKLWDNTYNRQSFITSTLRFP